MDTGVYYCCLAKMRKLIDKALYSIPWHVSSVGFQNWRTFQLPLRQVTSKTRAVQEENYSMVISGPSFTLPSRRSREEFSKDAELKRRHVFGPPRTEG
jgi:hypothetical protein